MNRSFVHIIPPRFRRRSLWVTLTVFLRALLNFVGLAVLIPVLIIFICCQKYFVSGLQTGGIKG